MLGRPPPFDSAQGRAGPTLRGPYTEAEKTLQAAQEKPLAGKAREYAEGGGILANLIEKPFLGMFGRTLSGKIGRNLANRAELALHPDRYYSLITGQRTAPTQVEIKNAAVNAGLLGSKSPLLNTLAQDLPGFAVGGDAIIASVPWIGLPLMNLQHQLLDNDLAVKEGKAPAWDLESIGESAVMGLTFKLPLPKFLAQGEGGIMRRLAQQFGGAGLRALEMSAAGAAAGKQPTYEDFLNNFALMAGMGFPETIQQTVAGRAVSKLVENGLDQRAANDWVNGAMQGNERAAGMVDKYLQDKELAKAMGEAANFAREWRERNKAAQDAETVRQKDLARRARGGDKAAQAELAQARGIGVSANPEEAARMAGQTAPAGWEPKRGEGLTPVVAGEAMPGKPVLGGTQNAITQREIAQGGIGQYPGTEEQRAAAEASGGNRAGRGGVIPQAPISTGTTPGKPAEVAGGARGEASGPVITGGTAPGVPPLQPGERIVTVRRPDGTTYQASFGDKYWPNGRAQIGKAVVSHGMLGEGEEIITPMLEEPAAGGMPGGTIIPSPGAVTPGAAIVPKTKAGIILKAMLTPAKMWDQTPMDFREVWNEGSRHVDEVRAKNAAELKNLGEQFRAFKGKRGKEVTAQKKTLTDQIEQLHRESDELQTVYETQFIEAHEAVLEEAGKRAMAAGVPEDKIEAFQEEFANGISDERPYIETNYNKTVKEIFDEVVAEYIPAGAAQAAAKTPVVVPPTAQGVMGGGPGAMTGESLVEMPKIGPIKESKGFPKAKPLVTMAGKVISKKAVLPILQHMAVKGGVAQMWNQDQTEVRMKSVLNDGVYEKVGTEFVRKPDMAEAEMPAPKELTGKRAVIGFPNGPELLNSLKQVSAAASVDPQRQVLNGTLLEVGDGGFWIVATDGRRLTRQFVRGNTGGLKPGAKVVLPRNITDIVLADDQAPALQLNVDAAAPADGGIVQIENGNLEVTGRLADGIYPNFRQVIPAQADVSWTVDKKQVLAALKQIRPFLNKKDPIVKLQITGGKLILDNIREEKEYQKRIVLPVEVGGLLKPADNMTIIMPMRAEAEPPGEWIKLNPDYFADGLQAVDDERVKLGLSVADMSMTPVIIQSAKASVSAQGTTPGTQASGPIAAAAAAGATPSESEATISKTMLPRQIDNAVPAPTDLSGKPIGLADIRRYVSEALDIPVRLGIRAPGGMRGALGIFRTKPETIRMKMLNDLPTLAHEVGHYLHYILLGDQPVVVGQDYAKFEGQFDSELLELGKATSLPSYTKSKIRKEGVAEFTRLYLTDPAKAIAAAPEFSAYWKSTLEEKYPAINDILNNARKQIEEFIRQPAKAKIKSMIVSSDQARPRKTVRDILDNLYDDWINQLGPIERTMDWLVKTGLPPEQAALVKGMANNFIGGWRGKVEFALHQAAVNLRMQNVGPSLKEILAKAPDMDDFRAYLIAKRAVELNERGKTTGIDTADAGRVVADLEAQYEPIRWKLRQFQAQQLQLLVDSGILGKEEALAMEMLNSMYVPFYRLYEGIGGTGGPRTAGGSGFVNVGQGVRRFKGSDRQIIDPLESIVRNAYVFRELAERNKIGLAFVKAVEQVQGGGRVGESVTQPIKAVPINTEEIAQILAKSGLAEEIAKQWGIPVDAKWVNEYLADKKVVAKVWRAVDGMKPKDGIFRVWQNGDEKDFQIGDPELLRALTMADAADAAMLNKFPFMKWMKIATAIKRAGSTLTFEFMGRNPFRDQVTAAIYSKHGYIPFVDGFRTIFSVLKRDDLYWDWVKNGGRYSDFIAADRTDLRQTLESVIKDPNILQQALSWINPINVLQNLQKLSEVMELTTRIGEYRRGLATGATPMEAANASKEVTLNFGRHGFAGAVVNRVVAFFNAGVQDPARMAREWKARPKQMLLNNLLYITMPTLLLWWLNKDDEEIDKLPGWRRSLFWNINLARLSHGPNLVMSVPKPFLEGVLFGTSFEAALNLAWKKDQHAVMDWFQAIVSQIPNPLAMDLTRPTIEVMANYDFFKGQQIINSGLQRLPAGFQTNPNTSLVATKVGQQIGISPLGIDHWIKGHFAGLTQYGLDLTDMVLTHGLALEVPPAPAKRISDLPLFRGFRHSPYSPSKYVDYFYSGAQKAEERVTVLKNPLTGFKAVKSRWFEDNKLATLWYCSGYPPVITQIRQVSEYMSLQTRAMALIQQDMKMDPEIKRRRLIEIKNQRDKLAEKALGLLYPTDR
jgi:hypothetical protein